MTSFTGSSTAMRRGATSFRCSRMQSSSTENSIQESALATPMRSAKRRKPSGVKPRRARVDERRHARVVPAVPVLLLDELDELPLGEHDVGEIEPGELDLLR